MVRDWVVGAALIASDQIAMKKQNVDELRIRIRQKCSDKGLRRSCALKSGSVDSGIQVRQVYRFNAIEKDIIIGYDVKKSKCDEVNCYLVTEKYLKSDKIVKAKQYSIGENDLFIYSTKEYEENGKENPRKAINYRNVKINIPIEDALFKIEDTMKIVIANSIDETIDMFFQKEGEAIVGQLKISEDKKKELNAKIMKKIDENKKGRKPL